jgi:hypothetical protein
MTGTLLTEHNRDAMSRLLTDPETGLAGLLFGACSLLAEQEQDFDPLQLDPETLVTSVQISLDRDIGELNRSKLIWAQTGTTDQCLEDLPSFIEFCNHSIAEQPLLPGVFDPANSHECAAGVLELMILRYDGHDEPMPELRFSDQIAGYLGGVLASEAILQPFRPLMFARMPELPFTDDPSLFGVMDENSQWVTGQIRTDLERRLRRTIRDLQGLKIKGKPLLVEQDQAAMLKFL